MTTAERTDPRPAPDALGHEPDVPFVLPPSRGTRSRRRREQQRRRRRRLLTTAGAALAALVVAGAVAVGAWRQWAPGNSPDAGAPPSPADRATPATARTSTALLVQTGPDGAAVSLTLLASAGRRTHLVLLPPGTMTEIPSFGLDAVGASLGFGGPALLQATVENLLGITLDQVVTVDDAQLANLVAPAGDLEIDLPERVEQVGARGEVSVLWEAGPTVVSPDQIGALLAAPGESNDLGRLARHQAFWEAWLHELRADPSALPAGVVGDALRPLFEAMAAHPPAIDLLPVEAVDAGAGQELYRVRDDELEALVREAVPSATTLAASGRPRVQVLNGTGAVGLAQEVTVALVQAPLRARVLYTGNADSFDHAETQVVFYDRSQRAVAEAVRRALGTGRIVFGRRPLGIVDVTVVVGRDFG